jgi:hypothetical protein
VKADDFFSKATRELRESGEAPPGEVDAVRARIMSTMRKSRRRSARTLAWVLPIAAVLAASTALATGGVGLRQAWHRFLGYAHITTDRQAVEPTPRAVTSVETITPPSKAPETPEPPAPPPADETPAAVATNEPAPPPPAVANEPAAPPPIEARKIPPKTAPRPSAPPPEPEAPRAATINTPEPEADRDAGTLTLYKKAHRLHFQEQKWAQALEAWNDYLREQPNGSLSVEARYNRALALVRLGRRDEARAALTPFARGEVAGGYRAAEAKSLLAALDGSAR